MGNREIPEHVALTLFETPEAVGAEAYAKKTEIVKMLIAEQVRMRIKVMTLFILNAESSSDEFSSSIIPSEKMMDEIIPILKANKIRLSAFGKWYDLPGSLVEAIKRAVFETETYQELFLNICLDYDGRAEIADACRVIALKVSAGKLEPSTIGKDAVKENLYSSYFMPPQLIIKSSPSEISSFLMWDSVGAKVFFTRKRWEHIEKKDLLRAIDAYSELKKSGE
jgi:undecaprenyl diphosphate synthase